MWQPAAPLGVDGGNVAGSAQVAADAASADESADGAYADEIGAGVTAEHISAGEAHAALAAVGIEATQWRHQQTFRQKDNNIYINNGNDNDQQYQQ